MASQRFKHSWFKQFFTTSQRFEAHTASNEANTSALPGKQESGIWGGSASQKTSPRHRVGFFWPPTIDYNCLSLLVGINCDCKKGELCQRVIQVDVAISLKAEVTLQIQIPFTSICGISCCVINKYVLSTSFLIELSSYKGHLDPLF